ncbi:MAG: Uma2 family endonuclease [Deltaproteobacteria bacterium]|nr:Uma2 family endonuclease [Deltaproteobacteria bacterium]
MPRGAIWQRGRHRQCGAVLPPQRRGGGRHREHVRGRPDLAILDPGDYSSHLPAARNVQLVIEVADSSLDFDRGVKAPLYARARIPEVWVVGLPGEAVEVLVTPHVQATARCPEPGDRRRSRRSRSPTSPYPSTGSSAPAFAAVVRSPPPPGSGPRSEGGRDSSVPADPVLRIGQCAVEKNPDQSDLLPLSRAGILAGRPQPSTFGGSGRGARQ